MFVSDSKIIEEEEMIVETNYFITNIYCDGVGR